MKLEVSYSVSLARMEGWHLRRDEEVITRRRELL
jgi:hypothetical protein